MAVTINGSTGVQLDDNDKQQFGTGNDLEIYHNATDSIIAGGTDLLLRPGAGNNDIIFQPNSGAETMLKATVNGSVNLYYDNSEKVRTESYGLNIVGSNHLQLGDDGEIRVGNGSDLQIYHDGTNSYIREINGAGSLIIKSNTLVHIQSEGGEDIAKFDPDGAVHLYHDNDRKFRTSGHGITTDAIMPDADNTYDLGGTSLRWDDVYATNGTIQTSDRNEKNTIVDSDLGLSFINKLKPVSYKFNNKTRTHYGLISQDIETVLSHIGKPTSGFAGFIKEDDSYGLRYNEFISPLIKAVQELSAEVETLKTKVAELEKHTHE